MMRSHFIESTIDVGSGFLLSLLIQIIIFPWFGLHPTIFDSIGITIIYTVVSIIRSSLWRHYFRRDKQKPYLEIGVKFNSVSGWTYRLYPDKDGLYWLTQKQLKESLRKNK